MSLGLVRIKQHEMLTPSSLPLSLESLFKRESVGERDYVYLWIQFPFAFIGQAATHLMNTLHYLVLVASGQTPSPLQSTIFPTSPIKTMMTESTHLVSGRQSKVTDGVDDCEYRVQPGIHTKVSGGAFCWPEYGLGADFEGYVHFFST